MIPNDKQLEAHFPLELDLWREVIKALELPPQQARVVELLLCGKRDKQIAATLGLGVPTVRTYLDRVRARTGAQDRVELILHVFDLAQRMRASVTSRES